MYEISGKYTSDVKVFAENIEEGCITDIKALADNIANKGKRLRFMPDCHKGVTTPIGTSIPVDLSNENEAIAPGTIGCDIGCTVSCTFFDKPMPQEKIAEFEHKIRQTIPFGFNINEGVTYDKKELYRWINKNMNCLVSALPILKDYAIYFYDDRDVTEWMKTVNVKDKVFFKSIPSVGGGNHFVEYDENTDKGKYAVLVHCGSRNLGQRVFDHYEKIAKGNKLPKEVARKITEEVKAANTDRRNLQNELQDAKQKWMESHIEGYLKGEDLYKYLVDVLIAQTYASFNHEMIHQKISEIYTKLCGGKPIDFISSTHNYLDYDLECKEGERHMMIRKGAIRSYTNERMLIPFNMKDGVAVCTGKSNPDWNWTAPHGSGRKMSRSVAFQTLKVEEFQSEMKDAGIYTTTADGGTLDEAPEAYKSKDDIIRLIEPTADILFMMTPKMNLKGSETDGQPWRNKKKNECSSECQG